MPDSGVMRQFLLVNVVKEGKQLQFEGRMASPGGANL